MNPYETPATPVRDESEDARESAPDGKWYGVKALMLALAGGATALLGLGLAGCGIWLIVANISSSGGIGVWAIIAFPIAIIALMISGVLLLFGLLSIRDSCRQYFAERKIHK